MSQTVNIVGAGLAGSEAASISTTRHQSEFN